jgi:hypothetical protein
MASDLRSALTPRPRGARRETPGRRKVVSFLLWILTLASATASAQTLGPTEIFLFSGDEERASPTTSGSMEMDYAIFAYELVAFVTKEVIADSREEYPESPLGSRLSGEMTGRSSAFGEHCLTVVSRVGAALPSFSKVAPDSLTGLGDLLRVASTALAFRQIWSAFKNDVKDDRRGLSLKPKVGAHRVGVNVTLHW